MKKIFKIEVDCAICAQKCEDAIKKVEGVTGCQINFMTQKMTLEALDIDGVMKNILNAARKVEPDFEIVE